MIIEYHRPESLAEAHALVARSSPDSVFLGGGTYLSHHTDKPVAVVDLQSVGLSKIEEIDGHFIVGATTTLQQLVDFPNTPDIFRIGLQRETSQNIRNIATIAGTIRIAKGKSPTVLLLLALDAHLDLYKHKEKVRIGDWLPLRDNTKELITSVSFPIGVPMGAEYISRTPQDQPLVSVAVTRWKTGRIRIVVGGSGDQPALLMDGTGNVDPDVLADLATQQFPEWHENEYYLSTVKVLIHRLLNQ